MYFRRIKIENLKSIRHLAWELPPQGQRAGWHVIIGDNGSGKSSFLRAVALTLVGPQEIPALRLDWGTWLRQDQNRGGVYLGVEQDRNVDEWKGKGRQRLGILPVNLLFRRIEGEIELTTGSAAKRHVRGGKPGWFTAAYGPYRRFSGGDKDHEKLFYTHPRLARHLSVFGETIALSECLRWLQDLRFKQLEKQPEGQLLGAITRFVNESHMLPQDAKLQEANSEKVVFVDGNGFEIPVEDLSDGFRSVLSMTFELIRQMAAVYGYDSLFDPENATTVRVPGVVLIDEIDAHLHPTWQRRVGLWFRKHFPNVQFLVTTHSPLICQAADVGSVFRLPTPGGREKGRMLTGLELERLLYGNILDAYGTEMFGSDVTRSDESKLRMARLAELNQRELHSGLSEHEKKEQEELRAALPTASNNLTGTRA